jgi:hypothetical protein
MIYGFEKLFLENLKKEIAENVSEIYFDDFDNLIAQKETGGRNKTLVGINVSENAFLINEIAENGLVGFDSLKELDKGILSQRVNVGNKTGFIRCDEKDETRYKIDFGCKDSKSILKFLKLGDAVYIKPVVENCGDAYFTNSKSSFLKDIFVDIIKNSSKNVCYAFIREENKGAYALGKKFRAEKACFISLLEDLPAPVCFIRKEGDYISDMVLPSEPIAVLQKEKTSASAYFSAGGGKNVIGVGLKCEDLKNGFYKINKEDITKLIKICKL